MLFSASQISLFSARCLLLGGGGGIAGYCELLVHTQDFFTHSFLRRPQSQLMFEARWRSSLNLGSWRLTNHLGRSGRR